MKTKFKLSAVLCGLLFFSPLLWRGAGAEAFCQQAQSTMYVKENTGIQTAFALTDIRKLTFPSGNMILTKTDGNTNTYALNDIRYLNFTDLTTDISKVDSPEGSMTIYPNPVNDQFQLSYESQKAGNVQLAIMDVQGKIVLQQTINSKNGTNHAIIPVSQLSKGLYLCSLQTDNKIEIIKFLKN